MSDELTPREIFDKTIPTPGGDAPKDDASTDASEAEVSELLDVPSKEAEPESEPVNPLLEETEPAVEADEAAAPTDAMPDIAEESEGEPEEALSQAATLREPPDDGLKRRWYAIHAHSGQEGNVQKSLRAQTEQTSMQDLITNILVPMEEVAEFKSGEKKLSKRKYFPGYVLIQLPEHPEKSPDLWHLIKDTPGVTGFIGSRTEPVPLDEEQVAELIEELRGERERPKQVILFDIGERVKVIDGPFANFMGNIDNVNADRGKLKVMIEIFERQTSVEVEFWQVEKV